MKTINFFRNFFNYKKKGPIFGKCLRCGDFLTTNEYKVKQDFLKHYDQAQDLVFEDKPLGIVRNFQIFKCEISVDKFSEAPPAVGMMA